MDAVIGLAKDRCGCSVMLVTKSICADMNICEMILGHPDVDYLADSRIDNIKKYAHLLPDAGKQSVMLRIPLMSEIPELVSYVDISQNSEMETVRAINEEALKQGKVHKVLLMVDLGDLREGMFYQNEDEIIEAATEIENMKGVELYGVGTNLTCFGAIIPKNDNLSFLCEIAEKVEKKIGRELDVISGGNSSSIYMAWKGGMSERINNLRLGESYLLGNDTSYGEDVPGTVRDAFAIEAQIIEMKMKPSLPIGEVGKDAFGQVPEYEDRGVITRAILGIGKQDTDIDEMIPVDDRIEILGGSSDHMILDMSHCEEDYKVGDTVKFTMRFGALLKAFTSPYVEKEYV